MTDQALADLLEQAAPVGEPLAAAGHRAYLVGGIVRDHLLGRAPGRAADIDLTTDALPEAVKAVLGPVADALWTQGERFGTIGVRIGDRVFEVTTHRAERYEADSRNPEVEFSTVIDTDLSRRDFTVNAMARRLPDGELIDPFGGRDDLAAGVLRTPIAAALSFTDDPLRMLRAARFASTYGFTAAPEVLAAIGELVDRLAIVSAERVRDELMRLLEADRPEAGLDLLAETGLASVILPELTSPTVRSVSAAPPDALVRLAVLLYPDDRAGRLTALRCSNEQQARVQRMMRSAAALAGTGDEDLRRFIVAAGPDRSGAVAVAQAVSPSTAAGLGADVDTLIEREGADVSVPLRGDDVVALLGIEPGPEIGAALDHLFEIRLREGPLSRPAAEAHLHTWWAERG